jgi:hypothetical protein
VRTTTTLILCLVAILALVGGCREAKEEAPVVDQTAKTRTAPAAAPAHAPSSEGTVLATMNSGGYTYVQVDAGEGPAWYAGPQTAVAVGDTVALPKTAMPMRNFESKTLGRTFDLVYFVDTIRKIGGSASAPAMRVPHGNTPAAGPAVDLAGIEKAEGGMTVAEVFAAGAKAAGNQIVLRGKVVKFNAGILGRNWVHVRDGSGAAGTNDITVTTQDTVKVGDTVLVTGKLAADRDFGAGYVYPLLIEEAKVVAE